MLRTRILTALVLIPIAFYAIYQGDILLLGLLALLLTLAEVEFCQLVRKIEFRPMVAFGVGLVWILLADGQFPDLGLLQPGIILILLTSLAWQVFFQSDSPVADWALTIASGLYLGLCGGRLLALRRLSPDGMWWTFIAIPSILIADSCAYFVGRWLGRHKMAPVLSPHKTWEGYVAGVLGGALLTALLAAGLGKATTAATISWIHGLILGLLIAILTPLGDLAISMIKRQVGAKNSGSILPGHGGALDRVDSILWTAVIGYYYVLYFVL